MCRSALVLTLALLVLTSGSAWAGILASSGWTISASDTDPFDTLGAASADSANLYLWLFCASDTTSGASRLRVALSVGGSFVSFTPSAGVALSSGAPSFPETGALDITLPGCPTGPFLAGTIRLKPSGPSYSICFLGSAESGWGMYPCSTPTVVQDIASIGYAAAESPCVSDLPWFMGGDPSCPPAVSVEQTSWGSIKAFYVD